jgi:Tfp pilus assembly protein PilP
MKESGRRQDVAFLALVVAVLAIVLALFVGMRSIQRARPKKRETKAAKPTQLAGPTLPKPARGPRDPFKTQEAATAAAKTAGGDAAQSLKLVGIVSKQGDQPVAIIHSAKKRYYVRVGDKVAGYKLASIAANQVVLEKQGVNLTLPLREPEPEEQ